MSCPLALWHEAEAPRQPCAVEANDAPPPLMGWVATNIVEGAAATTDRSRCRALCPPWPGMVRGPEADRTRRSCGVAVETILDTPVDTEGWATRHQLDCRCPARDAFAEMLLPPLLTGPDAEAPLACPACLPSVPDPTLTLEAPPPLASHALVPAEAGVTSLMLEPAAVVVDVPVAVPHPPTPPPHASACRQ